MRNDNKNRLKRVRIIWHIFHPEIIESCELPSSFTLDACDCDSNWNQQIKLCSRRMHFVHDHKHKVREKRFATSPECFHFPFSISHWGKWWKWFIIKKVSIKKFNVNFFFNPSNRDFSKRWIQWWLQIYKWIAIFYFEEIVGIMINRWIFIIGNFLIYEWHVIC